MQEGDIERALMEAERAGIRALESLGGRRLGHGSLVLRLDAIRGSVSLTVDIEAPMREEEIERVVEEIFKAFEEAYHGGRGRGKAMPREVQRGNI